MKCNKCNNDHDGSFGSGKFCSRACANSRVRTKEIKEKTSNSMKKAHEEGRAVSPNVLMTPEQIENSIQQRRDTWLNKLLKKEWSTLSPEMVRKRVLIEQKNKCNNCGLDEWMKQPLVLELEHKDGDHYNNDRNNVEGLCPNCHSLTETWRGRNKNKGKKKEDVITEEQMVTAYLEKGNIRQALLKLDLAAKGANYGRVKRALTLWNIEY